MSKQVKVLSTDPKKSRKARPDEGSASVQWWTDRFAGSIDRSNACNRWLQRVMSRHELRRRVALFNAHMYEDIEVMGLGPYQYAVYDLSSSRLRANLIRATTDMYVSSISRSKPKARVLTSDGNWELQKRARGMTRWGEAKADEERIYDATSTPCCRDSAVFGLGLAKVYKKWPGQPKIVDVGVKRVFPWELVVDDAEAQQPSRLRNAGHIEYIDRAEAATMWPEHAQYIMRYAPKTGPVVQSFDLAVNTTADLIPVAHLWHLPAYPGADDGLYVACVEGCTLEQTPWTRARFPFACLYRSAPTMGVFGVSIPHELRGRQVFINNSLAEYEECLHMYGHPKVLAPMGSFNKSEWSDELDDILFYNGATPPQLFTPSTVMPAETYMAIKDQWAGGFEQLGLNQQSAQSQLPEGLSGSGASIRAWDDVQTGRLYEASNGFESWHMEIFGLMFEEAREVAKIRPSFSSAHKGKTLVQIVKFKDVDPGRDKYWVKAYAESRLSKAPAQRLAQLQELWNGKVITDPAEFRELLEFPDLEGEDTLMASGRELAKSLIDRFLEAPDPDAEGVFVAPEPDWPLTMFKMRFQFAKLRAVLDNVPEENIRLLEEFISQCERWEQAALAPPPMAGAMAPGPPGQSPGLPAGATAPAGPMNVPSAPPATLAA